MSHRADSLHSLICSQLTGVTTIYILSRLNHMDKTQINTREDYGVVSWGLALCYRADGELAKTGYRHSACISQVLM